MVLDAKSKRRRLHAGTRVSDYLVVQSVLGEGGTAVVYDALHTRLNAPVALKVVEVAEAFLADARARLQREAKICATLEDPHVPKVYDVGSLDDGTPFVVMEKVSGPTLEMLLDRGRLRLEVIVSIADDLLEALEAIHRAGIVHRDLKPGNIIVQFGPSGTPRVRLMDFGVSKSIAFNQEDSAITQRGTLIGTPHYMAPEQITAGPIDARTDLYAVGVVLYEMMTRRVPFDGSTPNEVVGAVLRDKPVALRKLWPEVPPALEAVVTRAMATRPDARFISAREMRTALRAAVGPIDGRPLERRSVGERLRTLGASAVLALGAVGWPMPAGYDAAIAEHASALSVLAPQAPPAVVPELEAAAEPAQQTPSQPEPSQPEQASPPTEPSYRVQLLDGPLQLALGAEAALDLSSSAARRQREQAADRQADRRRPRERAESAPSHETGASLAPMRPVTPEPLPEQALVDAHETPRDRPPEQAPDTMRDTALDTVLDAPLEHARDGTVEEERNSAPELSIEPEPLPANPFGNEFPSAVIPLGAASSE